ncbi:MAG: ornithine cyclodeaminase family protein [Terriglobia bacterium]
MTDFVVYDSEAVRTLLDYEGCIHAVRTAMAQLSADTKPQPLRTIMEIAPDRHFALMPGWLPEPSAFGVKIITAFQDSQQPGHSAHRGLVVLFDSESGKLICVADAGEITRVRTAAASAVATDELARSDARKLGIFGCGTQAASHILAVARVRSLREVVIWGRSAERAGQLARKMEGEIRVPVRAVADPREAAASDIICTVTGASTPVLLGEWVKPGTHVNLVGSSHLGSVEVDHRLVVSCRYIVDNRRSALAAAAEFLLAKDAGLIGDAHIVAEIGDVLLRRVPGRISSDQITVYKSLGHIVQDLAAAVYVHARAAGSKAYSGSC